MQVVNMDACLERSSWVSTEEVTWELTEEEEDRLNGSFSCGFLVK